MFREVRHVVHRLAHYGGLLHHLGILGRRQGRRHLRPGLWHFRRLTAWLRGGHGRQKRLALLLSPVRGPSTSASKPLKRLSCLSGLGSEGGGGGSSPLKQLEHPCDGAGYEEQGKAGPDPWFEATCMEKHELTGNKGLQTLLGKELKSLSYPRSIR